MTTPVIDLLPDPPLPTDPEEVFDAKAGASLLAQQAMVPQVNEAVEFINGRASDAAGSAVAAAASAQSAEEDRAEVETNAAAVAANTATVVNRADEVAANTAAVAANTAQVATDAQAVADMLESIADGPVASVAGLSGVITAEQLNSAMLAYSQATALSF